MASLRIFSSATICSAAVAISSAASLRAAPSSSACLVFIRVISLENLALAAARSADNLSTSAAASPAAFPTTAASWPSLSSPSFFSATMCAVLSAAISSSADALAVVSSTFINSMVASYSEEVAASVVSRSAYRAAASLRSPAVCVSKSFRAATSAALADTTSAAYRTLRASISFESSASRRDRRRPHSSAAAARADSLARSPAARAAFRSTAMSAAVASSPCTWLVYVASRAASSRPFLSRVVATFSMPLAFALTISWERCVYS
mmetsp:Transcript_23601/g.58510  ORF Transcript_23601/g.58510 Transcript_23601/m.58510 type:complete len:265 (-) Transcript_23601:428-1222(-)